MTKDLIASIRSRNIKEINKNLTRANINLGDNFGTTPLMVAAKCGDIKVIKLLIENGADKNIVDMSKWKAYQYALVNGHTESAELLEV